MLTARRRHFAGPVSGRCLQACRDSEPGRDPSSSSSRSPRYVSMTSTSAAVTGIGSPRLSRTTGSPPDKTGAPGGGLIDGFGAVTALARDDRRREGGPRQLGRSVLLPISPPAQGTAGVVWSPCLAPMTMTRAGRHGLGQVGTPHSGADHPEPLTTRRVGTPCSAQRGKATRRSETTRVATVGALARSI
jgi:hypothetical protein